MATKVRGEVGVERAVDDAPLSAVVIEAIADAASVEPTELDVNLYETVDLDALERLCRGKGEDLVVTFSVDEHRVRVRGDSSVIVEPR